MQPQDAIAVVHQKGLPCRYMCHSRKRGYVWREGRENAIQFGSEAEARTAAKGFTDIETVWVSSSAFDGELVSHE